MPKGKDAEFGINAPLDGVNVVIIKQGRISVGDDIILLSDKRKTNKINSSSA